MITGRLRELRRPGALAVALAALLGWLPGGAAAGAAESGAGRHVYRVLAEHLVIRPADRAASGGYEVLDVIQVQPERPSEPSAAFSVPLFPGHEGVRVLDGLEPATVEVGPRWVSGRLQGISGRPTTVAVTYRVGPQRARAGLTVVRPYPVPQLRLVVHPAVSLSVGGADPEGEVDLAGVTYRLYARQGLAAGTAVVLSPSASTGGPGTTGGWPRRAAAFALALAVVAGLAAAGHVASRRRARRPAREPERLVDEVLALEAEYAAGYLEEPEYRLRRQQAMARLARVLGAQGAPPAGAPASGGPAGGAGP